MRDATIIAIGMVCAAITFSGMNIAYDRYNKAEAAKAAQDALTALQQQAAEDYRRTVPERAAAAERAAAVQKEAEREKEARTVKNRQCGYWRLQEDSPAKSTNIKYWCNR